MVNLIINGHNVFVPEGTTILEAAKSVNIHIPTLCYLKDINEVDACRVCLVEIEGRDNLAAACSTTCQEGMVVNTNTPRVIAVRRNNVQLLLSQHNVACTGCVRDGNCSLQDVSKELNITKEPFEKKPLPKKWSESAILQRDASKCIQCLRCINICDKVQGLSVWALNGTGSHTKIELRDGLNIKDINCALCGQCITHCPVGALSARDDTQRFIDAVADPEKVVVVQIAPAVRSAWGDDIHLPKELATEKRMVAAAKQLGADYVFDTDFSADLTIMEEGSELIEHIKSGSKNPMFTSCCPGWVRFMKMEYPDMVGMLSSAKSPQQMFGAVTKSYFAEKTGIDPEKIFCVSIMPCSAKKYECNVDEVNDAAERDVDLSLTTREFGRLLRSIDVKNLPEEEFDQPLGTATGAGVIFGATGGVMEAALRSAHFLLTGKNPDADAFAAVRGNNKWKEANFIIGDLTLHVAIASGLKNARALVEAIRSGEAHYDFVEIMACPGGCAGGGGQPIKDGCELASERGERLYKLDKLNKIRFSHENPVVQQLYKEYLGEPLSEKSEKLLHTDQSKWSLYTKL